MNEDNPNQIETLVANTEAVTRRFLESNQPISEIQAMYVIATSVERMSAVMNGIADLIHTQNEILLQMSKTNANGLSGVGAAIAESHGY